MDHDGPISQRSPAGRGSPRRNRRANPPPAAQDRSVERPLTPHHRKTRTLRQAAPTCPQKIREGRPLLGSPFFANAAGERIAPPTHCPAPLQEANRVEGPYGQYGLRDKRSQSFSSTPIIYTPFAPLYTPNDLHRRQITKKRPVERHIVRNKPHKSPKGEKALRAGASPVGWVVAPGDPEASGAPKGLKASPTGTSLQEHQGHPRRSHHQHDKKQGLHHQKGHVRRLRSTIHTPRRARAPPPMARGRGLSPIQSQEIRSDKGPMT